MWPATANKFSKPSKAITCRPGRRRAATWNSRTSGASRSPKKNFLDLGGSFTELAESSTGPGGGRDSFAVGARPLRDAAERSEGKHPVAISRRQPYQINLLPLGDCAEGTSAATKDLISHRLDPADHGLTVHQRSIAAGTVQLRRRRVGRRRKHRRPAGSSYRRPEVGQTGCGT